MSSRESNYDQPNEEDTSDQSLQSTSNVWDSVYTGRQQPTAADEPGTDDANRETGGSNEQQSTLFYMCHGCYNEFRATPSPDFPVLCPRCSSDFCEIIDNPEDDPRYMMHLSDEDDDEQDEDFFFEPLQTDSVYGRSRSERELDNTDSVMDMVHLLSAIMNRGGDGAPRASDQPGGNPFRATGTITSPTTRYTFTTTNFGRTPATADSGSQTEQSSGDSANATPMEQLANFLQRTFSGAVVDAQVLDPSQQGTDNISPQDMVSELMGRILNMSGNPSDYVYSNRHLDEIITQLMEQNETSNAPPPASEQDIESLPTVVVTPELLDETSECAICKDQYELKETVTMLPCKHVFHSACIQNWLRISDSCPNCRHHISAKTGTAPDNAVAEADSVD